MWMAPKGQFMTQDQQPTHFSGWWITLPVSLSRTMAPAMQASTQWGSVQ
jgi:hypothetical protein